MTAGVPIPAGTANAVAGGNTEGAGGGVDWSRLNDGAIFQSLVSELFLGLVGWLDYRPGPAQGPDQGWDGYYEGAWPFLDGGLRGVWMVECKHYKTDPLKRLKADLRGSARKPSLLANAVSRGADLFLLVTSARLDQADQRTLEALGRGFDGLRAVRVLSRVALEPLIRCRPWLLQSYFGHGPSALVSLGRWNPRIPLPDVVPLQRRSDLATRLKAAIAAGPSPRAVVLHGPGGSGKTRLLRESLTLSNPSWSDGRETLALQTGARGHEAASHLHAVYQGAVDKGRYLIVVDDANESFEERAGPLATLVSNEAIDAVLLLATRTGHHERLSTLLSSSGMSELSEVALDDVAADERLEWLRRAIEPTSLDDEVLESLVSACGTNLVLLSHAAQMVSEGRQPLDFSGEAHISRLVADRLEAQAQVAVGAGQVRPERVRDLLLRLAALGELTPWDIDNLGRQVAARDPNVTPSDVRQWVDDLVSAGVLRSVFDDGRTDRMLRFASDVEAELYLLDRIRGGSAVLNELAAEFSGHQGFIEHLAMLARNRNGEAKRLLNELFDHGSADVLAAGDIFERAQRLDELGPLAEVLSTRTFDLIQEVARIPEPDDRAFAHLCDRIVRLMARIVLANRSSEDLEAAVDRWWALLASGQLQPRGEAADEGCGDRLGAAIGDLLNPFVAGIRPAQALFDRVEARIAETTSLPSHERRLMVAVMTALLAPTASYQRAGGATITIYRRPLPADGVWGELNDAAWRVVEGGLKDPRLRTDFVAMLPDLADQGGLEGGAPLAERSVERRAGILSRLAETAPYLADIPTLAALHQTAMRFLAWYPGPLKAAAMGLLRAIPRTPELALYLALWAPHDVLDDMNQIQGLDDGALEDFRWGQGEAWVAVHERIARATLEAAPEAGGLVALLERSRPRGTHFDNASSPVVFFLVTQGYERVDAIMRDPALRERLPRALDRMVERMWVSHAPDGFEALLRRVGDLRSADVDDVGDVLEAARIELARGNDVAETLRAAAGHPAEGVRRMVFERTKFMAALSPERRVDLMATALRAGPAPRLAKAVRSFLEYHPAEVAGADLTDLNEMLEAPGVRGR